MSIDLAIEELTPLIGDEVVVLHRPDPGIGTFSGTDIDCAVRSIHPQWPLRAAGWRLLQSLRYDLRGWFWVMERDGAIISLDTIDDAHGLGVDGIRTDAFLGGAWGEEPSPATRAAYLTVKRMRKRSTDPSEWWRIGQLANEDPLAFAASLSLAAGPEISSILLDPALAGEPPDASTLAEANLLRHRRRFATPARLLLGFGFGTGRYIERILRPSGLIVLVVGPDGSGKSTVASDLIDECMGLFKRVDHQHWRPQILPRPGSFVSRPPPDPTSPHSRAPYGAAVSGLLIAYYWADFAIGAILREAPFKVRTGLIVRERGWWDIAVDPTRYRLRSVGRLVKLGAALLPRPDLVFVLEAPADEIAERKDELGVEEIARQSTAWRAILPAGVKWQRLDVTQPREVVRARAGTAVRELLEARAVSRLGSGWLNIPPGRPRWWIPRGPARVAQAGLAIYQPVTPRGIVAWRFARVGARLGAAPLWPRGAAPPRDVRDLLAPHIPARGTVAVSRGTLHGRFTALIIDGQGVVRAFAKVDLARGDGSALEAEAKSLEELRPLLPSTLVAPRVIGYEPGLLLLEPIRWRERARPWEIPPEVAAAVGAFFAAGRREGSPEVVEGPSHGDLAPWNLLEVDGGWALVDWEGARRYAPAFHDLCHFVVQGHSLLGSPTLVEVSEGFERGRGWVGKAVAAYAREAGLEDRDAAASLRAYLEASRPDPASADPATPSAIERRDALLAVLRG